MINEFTSQGGNRRPILAINSWPSPHGPFTPAPWAESLLEDAAKAPRTPNYNASYTYNQNKHWLVREHTPVDAGIERNMDKKYRLRLQTLLSVDEHIKQIVHLLDKKGELNNTYFIYTSDNGFQLGQHRLGADKRHLYENDIRVPFIIRGPGIPKNITTDRPVLNVDVAPTIYQIVTGKTEPHPNMDGSSILPYLQSVQETIDGQGEETDPFHREDFLISYSGEGQEPCGFKPFNSKECPSEPEDMFRYADSFNNTYHCVRSIRAKGFEKGPFIWCSEGNCKVPPGVRGEIYCRFEDDESFVEYYDLENDPWQLNNTAKYLTDEQIVYFESRLEHLRSCKGDMCRTGSASE